MSGCSLSKPSSGSACRLHGFVEQKHRRAVTFLQFWGMCEFCLNFQFRFTNMPHSDECVSSDSVQVNTVFTCLFIDSVISFSSSSWQRYVWEIRRIMVRMAPPSITVDDVDKHICKCRRCRPVTPVFSVFNVQNQVFVSHCVLKLKESVGHYRCFVPLILFPVISEVDLSIKTSKGQKKNLKESIFSLFKWCWWHR